MFSFFHNLRDEQIVHHRLCLGMMMISPLVFLLLRYVIPPNWGKTHKALLGPTVPPRIAWCLFEIPNLAWALYCYFAADSMPLANTLLWALFVGHYLNRSIVYPLTLNAQTRAMPLEVVLAAHLYTNVNGYVQSRSLCQFQTFPKHYTTSPQFVLGLLLFVVGLVINWQSDDILRNLRNPNNTASTKTTTTAKNSGRYVIPHGGLFRYVSAPHYLGEIIEWTGFALACDNSAAAWSFVIFSGANLIPRAIAHHQFYLRQFPDDYPALERTAIIPFVL